MTLCNFCELLGLPYLFPGSVCVSSACQQVSSNPDQVTEEMIWSLDTGGGGGLIDRRSLGHTGHGLLELLLPVAKWWEGGQVLDIDHLINPGTVSVMSCQSSQKLGIVSSCIFTPAGN